MAVQIEKEQLQSVLSSAYFSLMIDESTDIAVLNEMVIYARFIENGKVDTNFRISACCSMVQLIALKLLW